VGVAPRPAVRRCHRWHRHFFETQARDLTREAPRPAGERPEDGKDAAPWEPADHDPTPEEAALLREEIDRTLLGLDERQRQILYLGLLGFDDGDIGARVGRTEYSVRKVRARHCRRLQAEVDREPPPDAPV
jgi:DNA-directed RNA polymerase specialized sigma24 family protein